MITFFTLSNYILEHREMMDLKRT